jgi:multiple sugar transport system permease protein/putative aldouronate transport system permease protein
MEAAGVGRSRNKVKRIRTGNSSVETALLYLAYLFVLFFSLVCLLPFWVVLVASFTPETHLLQYGFDLLPRAFTTYNYEYVLYGRQVARSYMVSAMVTSIGTLLAICVTVPFAYVLSRRIPLAGPLSFLTYFTMVVGSGLVGFYILVANWMGLKDTIWALILPYLLNPFFVFILVAYLRSVSLEIIEAAIIDGANDLVVFFRIICPISVPAIATVSLFYTLQYWNDWWLALLFIDHPRWHPLQFMLRALQAQTEARFYIANTNIAFQQLVPTYGVRMATVCLTIGPIFLVYPFVQRYFVKGIMLGAVKE